MRLPLLAFLLLPTASLAGELRIEDPMVPLAPPGAVMHAAYMTISNTGDTSRRLVGVTAEGYGMAHVHLSAETDGVVTMSPVDTVDIAPGQTVALRQGGLHIMLMNPQAPVAEGDRVTLVLEFDDGETATVSATVMRIPHGS